MKMTEPLFGNGIRGVLDEALAENAIAKRRFEGLSDADREAFLRRAEGADLEKTKELLNELVGWQKGHAPYQL
jgi:hypothetical protein